MAATTAGIVLRGLLVSGRGCLTVSGLPFMWWAATNAEIIVPSVENPELSRTVSVEPGVDENVPLHALPSAGNSVKMQSYE